MTLFSRGLRKWFTVSALRGMPFIWSANRPGGRSELISATHAKQSTGSGHDKSVPIDLYFEALRRSQALWFRVSSGSMRPLLRVDDAIYIQPARADQVQPGEIIAFLTNDGLVVHRLLQIQQREGICRLLQMGDAAHYSGWITGESVLGRVVTVKRDHYTLSLQRPLAHWWGCTMAILRYRLYLWQHIPVLSFVIRGTTRLWRDLGGWYLHRWYRQNIQE